MKKIKAFTLAEVLITLTILGVVAAISVPNLIRSYKMKAVETQLKKSYSDLDNAIAMACAENNTDLIHLVDKSMAYGSTLYDGGIAKYFSENYIEPYLRKTKKSVQNDNGMIFETEYLGRLKRLDGSTANIATNTPQYWMQYSAPNTTILGVYYDNNVIIFVVDVNGKKKPNQIGYDIFYFSATSSYNSEISIAPKNQITCGRRPYDLNKVPWVNICDPTKLTYEAFCSCRIMTNNWKFPKDYPVKF